MHCIKNRVMRDLARILTGNNQISLKPLPAPLGLQATAGGKKIGLRVFEADDQRANHSIEPEAAKVTGLKKRIMCRSCAAPAADHLRKQLGLCCCCCGPICAKHISYRLFFDSKKGPGSEAKSATKCPPKPPKCPPKLPPDPPKCPPPKPAARCPPAIKPQKCSPGGSRPAVFSPLEKTVATATREDDFLVKLRGSAPELSGTKCNGIGKWVPSLLQESLQQSVEVKKKKLSLSKSEEAMSRLVEKLSNEEKKSSCSMQGQRKTTRNKGFRTSKTKKKNSRKKNRSGNSKKKNLSGRKPAATKNEPL